jgi:hypothetical protein
MKREREDRKGIKGKRKELELGKTRKGEEVRVSIIFLFFWYLFNINTVIVDYFFFLFFKDIEKN